MDLFGDPLFLTFLIMALIAAVLWFRKRAIPFMIVLSTFGFGIGTYLLWNQIELTLALFPPPSIWLIGLLTFLDGLLWLWGVRAARKKFGLAPALILVLAYALFLTLLYFFSRT